MKALLLCLPVISLLVVSKEPEEKVSPKTKQTEGWAYIKSGS